MSEQQNCPTISITAKPKRIENNMKFPEPSEFQIQRNIFTWARIMEPEYPQLRYLNGSLNGVRLSKAQAGKAKAAGMKKGYPDISLPWPANGYHGLYIELKKSTGSKTYPEQKEWIEYLSEHGYFAAIVKGEMAVKSVILQYLRGKL